MRMKAVTPPSPEILNKTRPWLKTNYCAFTKAMGVNILAGRLGMRSSQRSGLKWEPMIEIGGKPVPRHAIINL